MDCQQQCILTLLPVFNHLLHSGRLGHSLGDDSVTPRDAGRGRKRGTGCNWLQQLSDVLGSWRQLLPVVHSQVIALAVVRTETPAETCMAVAL